MNPGASTQRALVTIFFHAGRIPSAIAQARELFLEYAQSLGFSLCFQNFDQELAGLPGRLRTPSGRLLLAEYEGQLAGCVALHKLEPSICEMKRLYLRPQFRGKRLGQVSWLIAFSAKRAPSATTACAWTQWSR